MWRRVGGEMGATHTHSATTEMGSATTHVHGAAAKMSAPAAKTAAAKMGATAAAPEVSAATAATKVSATTTSAAETATASRVGSRRQAKGYGYCGRARRDFPHGTPRQGQIGQRHIARSVPAESKSAMLQRTRRPVRVAHLGTCA
jgi:hypothetical protein